MTTKTPMLGTTFLSQKWQHIIITAALLLSAALVFLILYGFVAGSTCQYSISLHVPDDERDVFMTCYRGKVVALQTKVAQDKEIISKWKVEARQLRYGDQTIYFVYTRTPLITDHKQDSNNRFNQISAAYKFLFYKMIRSGDEVYIFQNFPRNYIHKGKIEGSIDFWDS
ncbi:hypothetical protein VTH8203_03941 [Vibrio thalassae]|uniref:Uncharacterized protein n=1 Tax=Vibrio thalassae TaxID=1243014 RepID=A0A240ENU5_9VIBR|nr:hypothetical protein [Vibrio thalassae]SNX50286.1 hypothetical protein VTH8203_03941 [Vibrio thalassae]